MVRLERALIDLDRDLLYVIANLWDIDLDPNLEDKAALERLVASMAQSEAILETWKHLSEPEHEALETLQAREGRVPLGQFTRQYGEIRPMGPARREREKPWLEPANPSEALYYRGLIARGIDKGPSGPEEYIFIPDELLALLPTPTAALASAQPGYALDDVPQEGMLPAYLLAPDDLTAILAYFRLCDADARELLVAPGSLPRLTRYLIQSDPVYEALLVHLAFNLGLLANDDRGISRPVADSARPWLEAPRAHQLRSLAETWRDSPDWNDLRQLPGLEADEWPNDPHLARKTLIEALGRVPPGTWWSLESFVAAVKAENPDFQRPGGNYDSWYIYSARTGDVLHGFEHWDRIDGALIRWVVSGPMRWLGLVDWHPDAGAFRFTDLGAALLGLMPWPSEPDPEASLRVDDQSRISVPVELSRFDRYLVARFAAWREVPSSERQAYSYQITPQSLQRAAEQGISAGQIRGFLERTSARKVPRSVEEALLAWEEKGAEVTLEDVVMLVAKDDGVHRRLKAEKSLGGWLEQPLGPRAYAIAQSEVPALLAALRRLGLLPLFEDFPDDEAP